MSQDSLDELEKSILQSINSLKDEIINLKDIVIKNLQDENARLKEIFNRKGILFRLRIWMLVSLNRSCLAAIFSPPQGPCFYPTEKRNFSCLIGACIYQDL